MRLTVKPLKNRDPGSGMAVVDRSVLGDLGASSGDFVVIEGRDGGRAVARVWPSDRDDAGRGIVRIDGQLRDAANVGVDDPVTVEPTEVDSAEQVTVALPDGLRVSGDLSALVEDELVDQAVTAGQTVAIQVGFGPFGGRSGRRIPLTVVDTRPSGTVVIDNSTTVRIADRSSDEIEVDAGAGDDTTRIGSAAEAV